ncbi:MAG: serine/threonine protein kinase [Myxococcales bacterium]|nr:serine/threonine protein kinase [Myxococcales bacterium]
MNETRPAGAGASRPEPADAGLRRDAETVLARSPRASLASPLAVTESTRLDYGERGESPGTSLAGSRAPALTLPRLAIVGRRDEPAELDLGSVIGEGGMGQVHDAVQLSIGREVAVKTVHPRQRDNARAIRELLVEAQITGSLEHPNVVPIYSVGRDDDDLPLIVMKRIDGAVWSSVLRTPEHPMVTRSGEEALLWHLGILRQVCRAVHFAHSRGVVHRDLKPANVMIGAFGEVYVLDWGLALRLDPGSGAAARAASSGTPAYMAPEMVDDDCGPITARTDVFLLGAILHEILAGHPPWGGASVREALDQARACEPPRAPEDAPGPLVEIARRAMRRDPDARYASADELRHAIDGFVRHRGAASLAAHAERSLAELRELLGRDDDARDDDARDENRVHGLFGACRFGFDRALAEWPESPVARRGRADAYLLMVEFELAARRPGAAAALLAELEAPPAELVARVEALRRALAHDAARLELLEREVDVNANVGTRRRVFAFACLSLAAWNGAAGLLDLADLYHAEYLEYGGLNVASLVFLASVWWRYGRAELRSTFNRVYSMAFTATAGSTMLIWIGLGLAGTPFKWALALANVPQIVGAATVAFGIDARMRWLPVLYTLTGMLGLLWLEAVYLWAALSSVIGMLLVVAAWRRPRPEVVRSVDVGDG